MIDDSGVRKTVSKLEAGFKRFTNKFAAGDPKAFRLVGAISGSADGHMGAGLDGDPVSTDIDRRVLESIVKRIEAASRKEAENESDPQST